MSGGCGLGAWGGRWRRVVTVAGAAVCLMQGVRPAAGRAQDVPGSPAAGPPTSAAEFFQRVSRIDAYLRSFVDTSAVPGVSLALGVGDTFTHVDGFGYADPEKRSPVTPETRFRIGSASKALTAAALGRLLEEGRVKLDADVRSYVPEFPDKGYTITVRQLASHQSGIRHYRGQEAVSNRSFGSVLEAVSVFADDSLVMEPGTAASYSTYGYTLLSAAMERGAGEPFLSLMDDRVIKPLGLTHTGPEIADRPDPLQAVGYEPGSGPERIRAAPVTNLSNKWAGGGYVSTAGDLLKFARAHLSGSFLRPETLDALWTSQSTVDGTNTGLGLGWQVARMPDGRRLMVAGGNAIGGTTVVFVFPDDDVVVAFMTNMGNAPIRGVPLQIARILLGAVG